MTFGEKLQALRKHHGISQEALAEKLDISRTKVHRWESGQSLPDIKEVMQISELFMVSVDYLMYDKVEDETSGHFSDFQSLRILFWVCTAINITGMVISLIGWLWVRIAFPIVIGLIMELLACVFFEVFPPKGVDRLMMRYARRRFYAANIWIILPTPMYIAVDLFYFKQHTSTAIPYLIMAASYILIAALLTIYLMHQYRR